MSKFRTAFQLASNFKVPAAIASALFALGVPAASDTIFLPGNLLLSRTVYTGNAATVTVGQPLPPNCPSTAKCGTGTAIYDGTYPYVFFNSQPDGSFGVTSPIYIDQLTTGGAYVSTYSVPVSALVTSFSSKSELALNLSTDHNYVTFMGYIASANSLDISNSNTPAVIDPTNPVGQVAYRAVAQLDQTGYLTTTNTNAYSGNNGRAAFYATEAGFYYTVGNNNNGAGTDPSLTMSTGVEIVPPGTILTTPQQVGTFSITQYGYAADKAGKDNNFRGLTVFNDTIYVTKGSGGNGINTVYQVGTPGTLPNLSNAANAPITILPGFPTTLAKNADAQNPFGLFFANPTTLYVADEGDGTMTTAATSPNSGLQKWVFDGTNWNRVYVLKNGLNLGQPYSVPNYPANLNPSTAGLRNVTGRVNEDGTVTVWALTSTVSASGDQGADPNKLVVINDVLANTSGAVAATEQFQELRTAQFGEVLRGISFTPGTPLASASAQYPVFGSGLAYSRVTKTYNGTIAVRNNTSATANGPLSVTFSGLPAGVTLVGGTIVNGLPAVQALATGATLAPGATVTVPVQFSDPSNAAIAYSAAVITQ